MTKIFISHAHNDTTLAACLKELIRGVFGDDVSVGFSSDESVGGGIPSGAEWLTWILDQIRESDVTIVLLTPESANRPWLMWEAGAVSGIALALGEGTVIIPLLFRLEKEKVPGPLAVRQAEQGESDEGIRRVLLAIHSIVGEPEERVLNYLFNDFIPKYRDAIRLALFDRPIPLTEDVVDEWCHRLDELRERGRYREIGHLHRALLLAFTSGDGPERAPLDLRLHRRLGEIFLEARKPDEAVREFELALRLVPKDLYLLQRLTLAQMEASDLDGAKASLERIAQLDPQADTSNPEIAGLKGRLYREQADLSGLPADLETARDAYWTAMEKTPESYYMAVNAGELSLALGERERAREAFDRAEEAIIASGERNIWTLSTLANIALARNQEGRALALLGDVAGECPTPRELNAIRRTLERMRKRLGADDETFGRWMGALASGEPAD